MLAIQMLRMASKPAPTFDHAPGIYSAENIDAASFSITCSEAAVWTWTRTSTNHNSATPATGGSATTWTGSCQSIFNARLGTSTGNSVEFTVNATVRGVTYGPWTVDLICDGSA